MGQAKAKYEKVRQAALVEVEKWLAPMRDEETALGLEVSLLPIFTIPRASLKELEWARMKPQECHVNCTSYVELDPEKKSSVVHGWWKRGDMAYVFHSVVKRNDQLICITPYSQGEYEHDLDFIPDESIEIPNDSSGLGEFTRNGGSFPHLIRLRPDAVIAQSMWIKERLLKGMSAQDAYDLSEFKAGLVNIVPSLGG